MAVLATLAVPSFRDASLGSRLAATANSLHGSIQIARSEAIKANAPVTLCASADGLTCATAGDWDQGWIVLRTIVEVAATWMWTSCTVNRPNGTASR